MALTNYDDPYQDPQNPQDPYQNPGYVPPAGPLVDSSGGGGSVPTFRSTTIGNGGTGGGVPIIPGLVWLAKHFANFFTHGGGSSTPTAPSTAPSTPDPSKPQAPTSTTPSTTQQLLKVSPDILALILGLLNKPEDANANNPALGALNAQIPELTKQLNSLLQNDVQRRQMSDPLYSAVLRGAMGGLPVWMRGGVGGTGGGAGTGGGGLTGPVLGPRTTGSGVPSTPATDIFRAQGDDPEGYAFPNTRV